MAGDSPFNAADPEDFYDRMAEHELDGLGFTVGPREAFCPDCHLFHPIGAECW